MRISDHIRHLEALRAEVGDVEVCAYAYGDIDYHPVLTPEVQREPSGEVVVLVEGGYT